MLGDLVPTAGVAQGLALIVAPFMMLAWRGVGGVSLPPTVQALHSARVSLLLGRRLALVVTGGVGLDKGRDPYNGISTRNMLSFFFFLGKHEDFPKREFLRLHAFMHQSSCEHYSEEELGLNWWIFLSCTSAVPREKRASAPTTTWPRPTGPAANAIARIATRLLAHTPRYPEGERHRGVRRRDDGGGEGGRPQQFFRPALPEFGVRAEEAVGPWPSRAHTHTHTRTRPRANSLLLALIRS